MRKSEVSLLLAGVNYFMAIVNMAFFVYDVINDSTPMDTYVSLGASLFGFFAGTLVLNTGMRQAVRGE